MSDYWQAENDWYQHAPVARLAKALAQYDVYRSIVHLPGDVVEFGTFKGASLVRLATYRDVLESAHSRTIFGFDTFGEMPAGEGESDADVARRFGDQGECLSRAETAELMASKGFDNVELVAGDILETLPRFLEERPALRFALVNVDVLLKPVTAEVIRLSAARLVPGGVLMLDDYGKAAGATEAAEEFLAASSGYELRRASASYQPALLVRAG
ncbi:MAG TPA: class I SAM-dependent methyltransferase [Gaiellaceae bacterium]|nr:class I SAM-dependent methyltransferase [Gaiellaceae bacterium]